MTPTKPTPIATHRFASTRSCRNNAANDVMSSGATKKIVYAFASGPAEGEYYPVVAAVVDSVGRLKAQIKIRNLETEGSLENLRLIASRTADYALVQSNAAALAYAGERAFAPNGAVTSVRALGSLFPEPLHIIVSAKSDIRTLADLRGKRVDLGLPSSGTRADALTVLAAHGLGLQDFAEVREDGLDRAPGRLQSGRLDAIFATVGAPAREVQRLATRHPIRLIPLDVPMIGGLVSQHPGLVRLLIPAKTYPGQQDDVTAVAATALLVTHADVPDSEATAMLRLVFENPGYLSAGTAQGAKIAKRTGLRGITIPVHPAAGAYFGVPTSAPGGPGAPPKG